MLSIGCEAVCLQILNHACGLQFDISNPIADAESGLIAQGFLIRIWEETGSYRTPAGMLREADVGVARQLLARLVAAEYLSNEVANIEDVAVRLQEWINDAEQPEKFMSFEEMNEAKARRKW